MEDAEQGIYKLKEALKAANQSDYYTEKNKALENVHETRAVEPISRM